MLSEQDIEAVLAALRAGATIVVGGSRAHLTYGHENGAWYREDFDEGGIVYRTIDEADIRDLAIERPAAVQPLLRSLIWQDVQSAFADGDRSGVCVHLARWRRHGGDEGKVAILTAALAPADASPDANVPALIRSHIRDGIAFHLVMDTIGWNVTQTSAARGLAVVDRLLAISGDDTDKARELRERLRSLARAPAAPEANPASAAPNTVRPPYPRQTPPSPGNDTQEETTR